MLLTSCNKLLWPMIEICSNFLFTQKRVANWIPENLIEPITFPRWPVVLDFFRVMVNKSGLLHMKVLFAVLENLKNVTYSLLAKDCWIVHDIWDGSTRIFIFLRQQCKSSTLSCGHPIFFPLFFPEWYMRQCSIKPTIFACEYYKCAGTLQSCHSFFVGAMCVHYPVLVFIPKVTYY